jgi:multiple sugar transport system ATP-binding protein
MAVRQLSFEVGEGEFFCIAGPLHVGKTTTCRLIAGLENVDEGAIYIDGHRINGVAPPNREVSAFFEPVGLQARRPGFENLAIPLRRRKWPESEIRERVNKVAGLLGIEALLDRPARVHSRGELQRLGLAQTLVDEARVYVLDEPLRPLDSPLRTQGRAGLRRLQRTLRQTLVYATDDPLEALALADRVCVLHHGTIQQIDSPRRLYDRPTNRFVAEFVGSPPMNFVDGSLRELNGRLQFDAGFFQIDISVHANVIRSSGAGPEMVLGIRPEHIQIRDEALDGAIPATVDLLEPLGAKTIVRLTTDGAGLHVLGEASRSYAIGEAKWVEFDINRIHLIDRRSEKVLV